LTALAGSAAQWRTGKSSRDENFPVASRLVAPRHREPIIAFYEFARTGDDIADSPQLGAGDKVALLDGLATGLADGEPVEPETVRLKAALAARTAQPLHVHALELLDAFRLDATKARYANWDELMAYCALSAMPVGRYVLDVHGEDRAATWPASDAVCAALQIINHLQDCGKDYRTLDRVYLPADLLARHGARIEDLGAAKASPALRAAIREGAERTLALLEAGADLPERVADTRLALETAVVIDLAKALARGLTERDPLSETVHHGKLAFAGIALGAAGTALLRRLRRTPR
jgi:squalene synthase HpnC